MNSITTASAQRNSGVFSNISFRIKIVTGFVAVIILSMVVLSVAYLGFAIVAVEVKSLASQTAKATEEISSHILEIQGATQSSVVAVKEIGDTIRQISRIASEIASGVEQQSLATRGIAMNVQNVAAVTREVAGSIIEVNRGSGESGTASAEVLNSARALSVESSRLRRELDRLMANIRAA